MISCAAAYDQSIYGAMKLPSTRSLTMLNGNEMDMGTLFHPTAEGFCGPRGVFAELAGRGSQWAAGGIWSMLMREREFQVCLQFTLSFPPRSDCFVCLFVLHPGGWEKKNDGEMDYRIWRHISVWSSFYLSHILWPCRGCSWKLSSQNSLSAMQ